MQANTTPSCTCVNCPGATCRCGCQNAAPAAPQAPAAAAACRCGPGCTCQATPQGCRCG